MIKLFPPPHSFVLGNTLTYFMRLLWIKNAHRRRSDRVAVLSFVHLQNPPGPRPALTCGGQHGAGEEQRRGKVPVPVRRGVIEDGYAITAGIHGCRQEPFQALLGQAFIFLEKSLFNGPQLLAQEVFIWQLHRGEYDSAEYEIKDIT